MVANQGKITTLNDGISGTTGITDGTDKMHSGILKALFAIASGNRVIECGAFTEDTTGSFTTYTLAADIIYTSLGSENIIRSNQTVTMTAANATNTRHDLIYIDTDNTMKIKAGNDSATSVVPELDSGEVPVALIEVVGGSADNSSHNVQLYLSETGFSDSQLTRVKAASGASISKGQALYISGTHNANVSEVNLARADSSSTMPCIGIAFNDMASEEEGFAVVLGKANGVAANFTAGDTLYVSPTTAGAFTDTKPTNASHFIQNVGILFSAHASNASVKVTGVGRTNDVPNLAFVTADSSGLANGRQLNAGTGITVTDNGAGSTIDITNSAPDQTVSLTGAGITAVTGTYPNFTITSTEADTLDTVTGRGNTTTNDITVGTITSTVNQNLGYEVHNNSTGPIITGGKTVVYVDDITALVPPNQITLPAPAAGNILHIVNIGGVPIDILGNPVINLGLTTHPKIAIANQITLAPHEHITLQAHNDTIAPLVTGHMIISD